MVRWVGGAVIRVERGETKVLWDRMIPYFGDEWRSLMYVLPELSSRPADLFLYLVKSLTDEEQLGSQGVRRGRRKGLGLGVAPPVRRDSIRERGRRDLR